jgi:hypothetical protein
MSRIWRSRVWTWRRRLKHQLEHTPPYICDIQLAEAGEHVTKKH